MHWGCFVWTPTPCLSDRRTPRQGPVRVCVCVPFLTRSGGPSSWAHFGAPHLSCGRSWCVLCLLGPLRAGVALFPFVRPPCLWRSLSSGPGCLGPWRLVVPPPPFVFIPFVFFPSCLPVFLSPAFPLFLFFFASFLVPALPVVRCGGGLCVLGCGVCWCVLRWCCPCRCSLCGALSSLWRWLVLCGVACCVWVFALGTWLSSVVSWWVLVSCFGGAVPVRPRCSPPCGVVLATQFSLRRRRIRRQRARRYVPFYVTALTAPFICPFQFKSFGAVF